MNILTNLFASLVIAAWLGIVTIFSIQNVQAVSLQFLWFESVNFPVGVLSAFTLGLGLIIGALVPLLWYQPRRFRRKGSLEDLASWEVDNSRNW